VGDVSTVTDVALIDRLRALPTETEWVKFKRHRCAPQDLGEYLSALAKGAALAGEPRVPPVRDR